jgi:hypothetical protein
MLFPKQAFWKAKLCLKKDGQTEHLYELRKVKKCFRLRKKRTDIPVRNMLYPLSGR